MSRRSRVRASSTGTGSANPRALRCAIYTRVSTDQGLEQDFNSLDAQREACAAYIRSQAQEGWVLVPTPYDDGGYSGGNLDRPALKALLVAVAAKRIDVIVVYKVDRLTRSLADFAKLVEAFDAAGVSFISITQSFNTTTSMGRLTLNMLLSFAQFEREVTSERIRDKIAASKKKGIWVGGVVPLGYRVLDRKLIVDGEEAKTVRFIFGRYLELGSLGPLIDELRQNRILTRVRTLATGRAVGGVPFTRGPLAYLLKNRMYLGEINHGQNSYPGEHPAIIGKDVFDAVQAKLAAQAAASGYRRSSSDAMLTGKLFDHLGRPMTPSHAVKAGVRYRYYISRREAGSEGAPLRQLFGCPRPTSRTPCSRLWQRLRAGTGSLAASTRDLSASISRRIRSASSPISWGELISELTLSKSGLSRTLQNQMGGKQLSSHGPSRLPACGGTSSRPQVNGRIHEPCLRTRGRGCFRRSPYRAVG